MRDITKLHPKLQYAITNLLPVLTKQGLYIRIGECVRTVAEQDALYAKGRTAPGGIVTKAKGSSLSSMHQWCVAADFFLDMDIDGDGKKSDDAFNDKLNTFSEVGKIAQAMGLEWGGDWDAIVDKPHLQLPDWGSTPTRLKRLYGTPEQFMKSWYPKKKTVSIKSSKEDIKWLQERLNKCVKGYTIKVDGDYGAQTRIAVLLYWDQLGWAKHMKDSGKKAGSSTVIALAQGRKE